MEVQIASRKTGTGGREAVRSPYSPPTHVCDDAGLEHMGTNSRASKAFDKTGTRYRSCQDDVLWMVDVENAKRTPARRVGKGVSIGETRGFSVEAFVGCRHAHVETTDRQGVANVGQRFCGERETIGAPPVKLDEKVEVANI